MKTKTHTSKRQGFTLVEILVVITIIAVLAGVVFTVARRVKNKAMVAKGLNNHRQISIAYAGYLSDNANVLWYQSPGGNSNGGSGPLFGPQNYVNAPGYLCTLLENQGLKRAEWNGWSAIPDRMDTVWYSPASANKSAVKGHGATYFYRFLGQSKGLSKGATLAAVTDVISTTPYLFDYYGNYQDVDKLYAGTPRVYSYLDGHSDYR